MNVISRLHEQQRKARAAAKRREREQRRAAKRCAGAPPGGAGQHTTADVPERVLAACVGQQQACEAEALL